MPPSFTAHFCVNHTTKCSGNMFSMPRNQRYRRIGSNAFRDRGVYQLINSARVRKSAHSDATLLLFFTRPGFSGTEFSGEFWQLTKSRTSSGNWRSTAVISSGMALHSALLVATRFRNANESRFSFKNTRFPQLNQNDEIAWLPFDVGWRISMNDKLPAGVEMNGGPDYGWTMWPKNVSSLKPDKWYIRIHQKLRIDLDKVLGTNTNFFSTYDASFTYHYRLFFNSDGRLRAHGQRWGVWVEDKPLRGHVIDRLRPSVIDGLSSTTAAVNTVCAGLASGESIKRFYLLPGSQGSDQIQDPVGPLPPLAVGDSRKDVTIVVVYD